MATPADKPQGSGEAKSEQDVLTKVQDFYLSTVDETVDSRDHQERDRDYYDGRQYTDQELKTYADRNQPPVVNNLIKPAIDRTIGYEIQTRADIKAFPRNPSNEDVSEAATDALRYVADNSDFDSTKTAVANNLFVEGECASIIEVEFNDKTNEFVVMPRHIPWDRFFIDQHSARLNGDDAKFKGQAIWMDLQDALDMFPESDPSIYSNTNDDAGDTYDDKPNDFYDKSRNRVKVIEIYWNTPKGWMHAVFTGLGFAIAPRPSPYTDEFGTPICPIESRKAFIDRDNKAYGPVRQLISPQDEVNKRHSKALHLLSVRQVTAEEGAVKNINRAKKELAKPDGYIELNPGMSNAFSINETGDLAIGQIQLLQEAKSMITSSGPNPNVGGTDDRVQSGRALQVRQQGEVLELTPVLDGLRDWENRNYRQMWYRIKQFWTAEKWVRVTDDEQNIQFVGLNRPILLGEVALQRLQQQAQEMGTPVPEELPPELANDPRMATVVGVENNVQDMDMDIILEDVPDIVNLQAEQFEILANLAATRPEITTDMIIESSNLRNKDHILERMNGTSPEAAAALEEQRATAAKAEQLLQAEKVSEINENEASAKQKMADAANKMATAKETQVDTQLKLLGVQ